MDISEALKFHRYYLQRESFSMRSFLIVPAA
jgi:hypothetical protein